MTIYVRPSKTFVFEILQRTLLPLRGDIGIDGGAANLKNRHMFQTKKYYGIDIDRERLSAGIRVHQVPETFGIWADLARLEKIPSASADVIVSTNTLYVLSPESVCQALSHFVRITKSDGVVVIELPLDGAFDARVQILQNDFSTVRIVYYKNSISRLYESIFERNGFLGSHPIAGSKPFLALSWLLSRLEYLTAGVRRVNRHALIIARKKVKHAPMGTFDLSGFLLEGGIYDLRTSIPE